MSLFYCSKRHFSIILTSIFICIVLAAHGAAATYYVKNGGNDSADGLSDGNAWATIAKVNSVSFSAGDNVLFSKGSSWSDTLIPGTSGTAGSPITFDAYGSGDAPVINVNYDTSKKRNLYISGKSHLHIRNMTFRNGTNEGEAHIGSVEISGSSDIVLEGLTVADTYSKCGLMVGSASSNVTVKDCAVYGTEFPRYMDVLVDGGGILVGDFSPRSIVGTTDGISVISCEVYDNTGYGITIFEASNNRIAYNTIYNNGGPGIWGGGESGSHSSGNIVERNTVYENCQGQDDAYGIDFYRPGNNNIIRYNRVYSQFDTVNNGAPRGIPFVPGLSNYIGTGGIRFDGNNTMPVLVTQGNIAHNNLVYNNYHGFEIIQISNTSVFNNTIYNNFSGGRAIGLATSNGITPKVSGTVVKNNLIYGQYFLMFDYNTEGSAIDNNLYYSDNANLSAWGSYEAFFFYPSAGQANQFSLWQATGHDQHSVISSDPLFVNASTGDLHINAGSPAVDIGTTEGIDIPSSWLDYDGTSVPQGGAPDAGAYEQVSGEVAYTITASSGAGGSITPSGAVSAAAGSSIYFAITPEAGYYIADVVIDSISTGPIAGYLFSGVTAGHTISVVFSNNWSRTYYVDASSGSNSNTGTSETKAWQTLSKVNEMKFNPGDTVKLKSGETFSGALYVYQSGTDGSHVVFDSYGGSDRPVIDASGESAGIRLLSQADVFGSGSDQLSYVTVRNLEVKNADVANGESAGVWGAKLSNIVLDGLTVNSCRGVAGIYIDAPNEYVTISNSIVRDIASTTEARTAGIFGFGIVVSGTAGSGNSSHNTISDNAVYNNHNSGISVSNSSDNTISGNTVYLNGDCGIGLSEPGAHRNIIENNTVYENCQYKDDRSGINLFLVGNDNIVRYNKTYAQYDTYNDPQGHGILINTSEGTSTRLGSCGIRFDGGHEGFTSSTGNIVHTNLITGEGDGYQVYNFADTQFFNNTVYNSRRFGVLVNGTHAASAVVKNNIVSTMDGSATVGGYKHLIMISNATGYEVNNNLYFPDAPTMFNFNETKTGFAAWQAAQRDDASLLADPAFAGTASGDFSLQSGSQAIDLGTTEGISQPSPWKDLAGNDVPYSSTLPDAGAYESQTAPSVISGTVKASTAGNPALQNVLVWLMDSNFAPVGDYVLTDPGGNFSITHEAIEGYLYVRPPTSADPNGYRIFSHQPRIYVKPVGSNSGIDIRLPQASNLVIRATDLSGNLMDKASFEAARANNFSQFMTLTNTNEEVVPHVIWEIEDQNGRTLPAIIVDADQAGGPFAIDVLFWQTASYGKLLLTADNSGTGYHLPGAGSAEVIDLNQALLDTVNSRLQAKSFPAGATLDQALGFRDTYELSAAQSAINTVRKGTVEVTFKDLSGNVIKNVNFTIRQRTHDFMFGAFQGAGSGGSLFDSDTARQNAYTKAKEAGLGEITAVGLGWSYTEPYANSLIDQRHGISSLKNMGYKVKIHGATWLWEGVLPDRIKSSTNWSDIISQNLGFRSSLLASFDASGHIWESMNEPAYNNYVNMPRSNVVSLVEQAAAQTNASTNIVNGPHEFDFGTKYLFYGLDNEPANDYPLTYSEFLRSVSLSNINTIGIQFYPGYRLTTEAEGPAVPPFWLADTVDRYGEMFPTKDIHITEFSVSSNGGGWTSGYWKNQWDAAMQSEYADRIFTLMFANPKVKSIIWWDILDDADTSVVNGGLLDSGGTPKTAYNTLKTRITQDWSTNSTLDASAQGQATITGFGGTYEVTYVIPSQGPALNTEGQSIYFHISEQSSGAAEIVLPIYTVTATSGANGSISPAGQIVTTEGGSVTFAISADSGYVISSVLVDGASVGALNSYTFSGISASHTIEAVFSTAIPSAPSGLGASGVSTSEANLTWEDNSDNEEGFRVERSLDGSSWGVVATKAAGSVSHSDSGLSGHTRYYYRVYAFNGAGSSGYSNVASAETMNSDPILSPIGNKTTDEGQALIFTVSATDPDGDSVTYEAAPLPSGAAFNTNTGAFSWTPTYSQSGTYEVTFKARDGYGGYSQEAVTITVMNVPRTYTISASAGTGGSISPSGAYTTQEGTSTKFTVTADTGYSISNVYVDGENLGGIASYTFTNVQSDHSIEAVFALGVPSAPSGLGASGVSTSEANLTWEDNSDNEDGFSVERSLDGSSWGLVATKDAGAVSHSDTGLSAHTMYYYRVYAFNGAGSSGYSNVASAETMNSDPVLSPIGSRTTDEGQALIFTVSATDPDGDSVTYEAAPLPSGAAFNTNTGAFSWTPSYSQSGTYEVTFKARDGYGGYSQEAVTITVMNVPRTYTISASAGTGGSISPSGAYTTQEGTSTKFTVTADTGYSISNVYVDGENLGGIASYTFTNVQSDHSIEAVFAINTYTITASAGAGGTIDPSGAVAVDHGSSRTFSIVASTGYDISSVAVDGAGQGAISSYTFSNVTADHSIEAVFAIKTYTITASSGAGGSISPSSEATVDHGESVTFTISAEAGYSISSVLIDGENYGGIASYTFSNISAGHTISVLFSLGVPSSPSGLNATAVTTAEISLSWMDNSDNEDGFRVERSPSGTGALTIIATLDATSTSYTNSGLAAGTTYHYRVHAYNSFGNSGWSNNASAATQPYTPVEEVYEPGGQPFSQVSSTVIAANWTSGENPGGTLYFCENTTAGTDSGWTEGMQFISSGLTPDQEYSFRVKAKNSQGAESQWVSLGSQRTTAKRSFRSVKNGDLRLIAGDVLGSKLIISIEFDDVPDSDIIEVNFYLDDDKISTSSVSKTSVRKTSSDGFVYELDLSPGDFTLKVEAIDVYGNIYEEIFSGLKVFSADNKSITGAVLPYPNPYDSNAGDLRISYTLSSDTDVVVYIFDITGRLVYKSDHTASMQGGLAGYNEITWDGRDMFGSRVENDLYLVRIVDRSSGKLLGKCKVMVLKR